MPDLKLESVEVLSLSTLLVKFSGPLSGSSANFNSDSYSIAGLVVRDVLEPFDNISPAEVVLHTDRMAEGVEYVMSAAGIEAAAATSTFDSGITLTFTARQTKLDKVLAETPTLFDTSPGSTARQLITAIHRENEKIGGNFSIAPPRPPVTLAPVTPDPGSTTYPSPVPFWNGRVTQIPNASQTGLKEITNDITVEYWLRPDDAKGDEHFDVFRGFSSQHFKVYHNNSYYRFSGHGLTAIGQHLNVADIVGWRHVCWTRDASTGLFSCYINGVLGTTTPSSPSSLTAGNDDLTIGSFSTGTFNSGAGMAEVRIWNVVRTPAEIAAYYNVRAAGDEAGLVACYPMGPDNWDDLTANGNHLSLIERSPPLELADPTFSADTPF